MELMLSTATKCFGVAFILKALPKLDDLGVLFQKLRVEGSRCFNEVSQLLLNTPYSHIGLDAIFHLRIIAQKYDA